MVGRCPAVPIERVIALVYIAILLMFFDVKCVKVQPCQRRPSIYSPRPYYGPPEPPAPHGCR
jgi:hypothetical protein